MSETVWILAYPSHRWGVAGVFKTEEAALRYAQELADEEDNEDWELDDDAVLEEHEVQS